MRRNIRFEECFRKYQNLVMRIVVNHTSDYQLAQEILQQVFCEFYVHMEEVHPASEKTWIMRSTKNAVIDYLRKKQRWAGLLADTGVVDTGNLLVDEAVELWEEQFTMKELTAKILEEVKMVNVQWYEALVLCFVEELSYTEAAERLNISESVLRSRICRARAYIRERFWDEYMNKGL